MQTCLFKAVMTIYAALSNRKLLQQLLGRNKWMALVYACIKAQIHWLKQSASSNMTAICSCSR